MAGGRAGARGRILAIAALLAGVAVPAALTWAAFASHHAGSEFITNNFLLNAKWKHFTTNQFVNLLETSGPILVLALVGLFARRGPGGPAKWVLICTMAGLFAGVLIVPAAHRQYYLLPLPIVCLFAVDGLSFLAGAVPQRARAWLIGVATIALAMLPVIALVEAYHDRNDGQLAKLRTVFERTQPTDLVMDGWEGMGAFRPHAFFYFFLHEETRAMLPAAQWNAYLDALESGRIRPKLIVMDENLEVLGPRFQAFVHERYASDDGVLYFSRQR